MTRRLVYTCDGCKAETSIETGLGRPGGWGGVTVGAMGFNVGPYDSPIADIKESYDLCSNCQRHLADMMDPTSWPRAQKVP